MIVNSSTRGIKRVLFIHGGGVDAFRFDSEIVTRLRAALAQNVAIDFPRIAGLEQIEWSQTAIELSEALRKPLHDGMIVAHSIGGAATLKLLSSLESAPVRNLFLMAAPYKFEDSHWGVDDFTIPDACAERLDQDLKVKIFHSSDDDIIPVGDALLYKQKLPDAQLHLLDGYGHQFSRSLEFLANDIRSAIGT